MGKSALYFEWREEIKKGKSSKSKNKQKANQFKYFMLDGLLECNLWEELSTLKVFKIVLSNYEAEDKKVILKVFLMNTGIKSLNYPSEYHYTKQVLNVVSYFFGVMLDPFVKNATSSLKHDADILYKAIKLFHKEKRYCSSVNVQHSNLIPILRPYQAAAVRWMLTKEGFEPFDNNIDEECTKKLHPLFREFSLPDKSILYYNCYGHFFVENRPIKVEATPGGILADEMGLGKTVEVLSCVLNHPRKNIPKPSYMDPIIIENIKSKKKKKNPLNDIYIMDNQDRKESSEIKFEESSNDLNDVIINDINKLSPEIIKSNLKVHLPNQNNKKQIKLAEEHNKIEIKDKEEEEDDINEIGRPKRKRKSTSYAEYSYLDNLINEDEKPKLKKSRVSKNFFNPDKVISESTHWTAIESAVIKSCWNGDSKKYKKEGSYKEFKKFLKMRNKDPYYMMSLRERLTIMHERELEEYTMTGKETVKFDGTFFDEKVEQKSYFECICGESIPEIIDEKYRVQCLKCSLWQHADCVAYDVSDSYRGEYICPHCWVQETPIVSGATLIVAPSSISYQVR